MKLFQRFGALALVGLLGFGAPSCTIVAENGQEVTLEEMTEEQYESVKQRVYDTSLASGGLIQIGLAEDPELRADIAELAGDLSEQVEKGRIENLQAGDVVSFLLSQFGESLNLEPKEVAIITGISRIVDAATGGTGIELGIEGTLSDRERGLLVAMLDGLALGVK